MRESHVSFIPAPHGTREERAALVAAVSTNEALTAEELSHVLDVLAAHAGPEEGAAFCDTFISRRFYFAPLRIFFNSPPQLQIVLAKLRAVSPFARLGSGARLARTL